MKRTKRLIFAAAGGLLVACWLATTAGVAVTARANVPAPLADIASNDNTAGAGLLNHGTLHIALVARRGLWYPDGPGTIGLPIEAFGEAGRPLRIPGPLVRAPLGTHVVASIRNDLTHDLTVRGLAAPAHALTTVLRVPRGATRRVEFDLDRAGAFGYYGSDKGETIDGRIFADAELSGAIVVEAPHVPRVDHVFVLGLYAPVKLKDGTPNFLYFLETINGRAFPATERLAYERGRTVRWAVFNASAMLHPMHLHGFYFRVDRPDAYDEVTHPFYPGDADELSWTADRAGDWMFHCHIDDHITRHAPLRDMLAGKGDPQLTVAKRFHLPNQPMGGMVIALKVVPRPGDRAPIAVASARRLALDITSRDVPSGRFGLSHNSFTLTDGDRTVPATGSLGPPIVLTQGRPVAIAVTNRMDEATSVHWHGIALQDSYYDGGAGMGMSMDGHMPPAIEPGHTFVARFVPPDAGTFTYHSHMDDGWQLAGGLVGPLIVLPPGQHFDAQRDHIVMISESSEKPAGPPLAIDGALSPPPLAATAGVPQRLRFADLTLGGENLVVSLSDGSRVLDWTPIAKDGRDLPARLQHPAIAIHALTIGETRDFRFTPAQAGTLTLAVYDLDNNHALVASQQIQVSAP
ncbi:MAG: multicopper oxidase domain-containing protein [Candidatus Eremiobacteraeota bacterium]|nr:multicopper oxidase domain-containing protein [Candidatus Eremiobacteraeota bacterium]MBC5803070.1 multicopper oxidase domain-containing protein [Candidatus Eremiobacteraeota bacterium]MBC5823107.1 multicopper oxidase domain-containing protein [Candidatus Eremiobacteraeota bacterium]